MASKKKKKEKVMVHKDEGAAALSAMPMASSPVVFAVPKSGQASVKGSDHSILVAKEEENTAKFSPGSGKIIKVSASLPVSKSTNISNQQLENLPPDRTHKGVKITLDNNNMWNDFYRCKTEMIITKQGCRMFPYCRFRISGLEPFQNYALLMDIYPVDNKQYKWSGQDWQANGKAETHIQKSPFVHPESPKSGHYWMQNPVSFYKLKLTNNLLDQEGNVVLHSSHRYLPRLYVVLADKATKDVQVDRPDVITVTFPQTEFFAVTAYQNSRFTQLKVDYNPFAKGFRDDGPSSLASMLKSCPLIDSKKDEARSSKELNPVKKSLKSLLANNKPKNSKGANQGPQRTKAHNDIGTSTDKDKTSGSSEYTERNSTEAHPSPRNFSELIRESHVKLRRCTTEKTTAACTAQFSDNNHAVSKFGSKEVAYKEEVPKIAQSEGPSAQENVTETSVVLVKGDQNFISTCPVLINPQSVTEQLVGDRAKPNQQTSNGSSVNFEPQRTGSDIQTPDKVKPRQRPPPMPLPALAQYLKQLRSKSTPNKTKSVIPSTVSVQPNTVLKSSFQSNLTALPAGHNVDSSDPSLCANGQAPSNISGLSHDPFVQVANPSNSTDQTPGPTSEHSNTNADTLVMATENKNEVLQPLFIDRSLQAPQLSTSTTLMPPLPVRPSLSETLESVPHPVLCTQPVQEQSSKESDICIIPEQTLLLPATLNYGPPQSQCYITDLPSYSPLLSSLPCTTTSNPPHSPLLPGPEHLSCGVESLSPKLMPDPEPCLSSSDALESISTTSLTPTSSAETFGPSLAPEVPPTSLRPNFDGSGLGSSTGVSASQISSSFSVLPPPDPFLTAFTSFLPAPHSAPFSLSRHSLSLPHPGPLDLGAGSSLSSDPDNFQVNDQTLPFPSTLSPLALPLSLSPSFSSLGPDPLSPTPSFSDLVQFFSNNDDLEIDEDFPSDEPIPPVPCPPSIPVLTQPMPASKPRKPKGKSKKKKSAKTMEGLVLGVPAEVNLQPNLEEVEEQLFVSFTSKEALEIHLGDTTSAPQDVAAPLPKTSETTNYVPESAEEKIATLEEVLLKDIKLMKHRQVIHPVLQEVGLKMSLLDPTLAIDLQYLGVRLPIPQPFSSPELSSEAPSPSGSAAFVSRTGKTKDVTQIKGWKEKFAVSESSSSSTSSSKTDVVPSSDGTTSKNLSAFCSDMLDEYLASEGKLIDERAASFTQTVVNPVTYELPTRSTSYVRTLDSVLKKQTIGPNSSIISDFIPPSKRPKLSSLCIRKLKRTEKGQKQGLEQDKTKLLTASATTPISAPKPQPTSIAKPGLNFSPTVSQTVPSEHTAPITSNPKDTVPKKKRKKSKGSEANPENSADMAPLESDSELGPPAETIVLPDSSTLITKTMLKQKDLEDGVVWEGRQRTCITEERAEIALSSLFTLAGFVCENPTAPVSIIKCRAPPCLNVFCRLGCVCSSLTRKRQITHCGKTECIFGCSCFRQKVVLLKNFEGPDSSASDDGLSKKRRKRRMRMAYTLKEAEMVSQPVQRVRGLWKPRDGEIDPEPVHQPTSVHFLSPPSPFNFAVEDMTCARVRAFQARNKEQSDQPSQKASVSQPKSTDSAPESVPQTEAPKPSIDSVPSGEPSKRLEIVSECQWKNRLDRNYVLRVVCERMAKDCLTSPFRVKGYLVRPLTQSLRLDREGCSIAYKVHICHAQPSSGVQVEENEGREEKKEEDGMEDWQREIEDDVMEEAEDDFVEKPVDKMEEVGEKEEGEQRQGMFEKKKKKALKYQGLPFLTGISPAGILTATKKQSDGSDQELVQVNGRFYPCAKIQLGKMGAIHPANRLAAYLTGRLSLASQEQGKLASSSSSAKTHQQPSTVSVSAEEQTHCAAVTSVTTSEVKATPVKKKMVSALNTSSGGGETPKATMLMIPVPGTNKVVEMPCPSSHPLAPITPDQRMLLQPIRSSKGTTVYRNPEGKLIQLVPLSQLQALNPNLVVQKAISLTSTTPVLSTSSAPSPNTPSNVPYTHPPAETSPKASPNVTVLSRSKTITLPTSITCPNSAPGNIAGTPPSLDSLGQKGKCTLKILPLGQNKTTVFPTALSQSLIKTVLGSFTLLQPPPNLVALKPRGSENKVTETEVKSMAISTTTTTTQPSSTPTSSGGILGEERPYSHTDIRPITTDSQSKNISSIKHSAVFQKIAGGSEVRFQPVQNIKPISFIQNPHARKCTEPTFSVIHKGTICQEEETYKKPGRRVGKITRPDILGARQPLVVEDEVDVVDLNSDIESEEETDSEEETADTKTSDAGSPTSHFQVLDKKIHHNVLERWRRGELKQRFKQLREELKLEEKSSKVHILSQAVKDINILEITGQKLEKEKASLAMWKAECLRTISQLKAMSGCEEKSLHNSEKEPSLVKEVTDVVSLLNDSEEKTDNSSDEEISEEAQTVHIVSDEEEMESVDRETVQNKSDPWNKLRCNTKGQIRRKDRIEANEGYRHRHDSYKTGYYTLRQTLDINSKKPMVFVLNQASKEIRDLRNKSMTLEKLKAALTQTRKGNLLKLSHLTGKSEENVLKRVQKVSRQKTQEDQRTKCQEDQRRRAPGSTAPPVALDLPQKAALQSVLQPSDRTRTIPNILSRRKKPPLPTTNVMEVHESPSVHTTVLPGGQLPMIIPVQQIITMTSLQPGSSSVLHPVSLSGLGLYPSPTPGVASVTIRIPSLSQQPIQVKTPSLSFSSPGPNVASTLPVIPAQQHPAEQGVSGLPQSQSNVQLQVLTQSLIQAKPPGATSAPIAQDGALTVKRVRLQDENIELMDQGINSPECMEIMDAELDSNSENDFDSVDKADSEDESLTSLLNEIVFLNQQISSEDRGRPVALSTSISSGAGTGGGTRVGTGVGVGSKGEEDDERSLSPLFLRLDDDLSGSRGDKEKMSSNLSHPREPPGQEFDHHPGQQSNNWSSTVLDSVANSSLDSGQDPIMNAQNQEQSLRAPPPGTTKGGTLTLPPLLQMKLGGVAMVADNSERAEENHESEVAWRPMPRLAPLGLKTNPQS